MPSRAAANTVSGRLVHRAMRSAVAAVAHRKTRPSGGGPPRKRHRPNPAPKPRPPPLPVARAAPRPRQLNLRGGGSPLRQSMSAAQVAGMKK